MDQGSILGIVGIVMSIGGTIFAIFNHKRLRSHCCGKDIVASIDVESTTPPDSKNEDFKIKIPSKPENVNLPSPPRLNRITYDA